TRLTLHSTPAQSSSGGEAVSRVCVSEAIDLPPTKVCGLDRSRSHLFRRSRIGNDNSFIGDAQGGLCSLLARYLRVSRQSLSDDLIHVVILVGRKPSDEMHA